MTSYIYRTRFSLFSEKLPQVPSDQSNINGTE